MTKDSPWRDEDKVNAAFEALSHADGNDRQELSGALRSLEAGNTEDAVNQLRTASVNDRQPVINALNALDVGDDDNDDDGDGDN